MTAPTNGRSSGPYRVVISEYFRQRIMAALANALQAGTAETFRAAFRQISERLRADPWTFGEPKYRLPALRLQVRQAAVKPIVIDYAVHEEQPVVFIRGFIVLA
jgi:vacuolar-type H+-ATPase catalytic subunit A/Vma1